MIRKHRTNWLSEMTSNTYDSEMKSKAMLKVLARLCFVAPLVGCSAVGAQEVRVYSGRHYNTDRQVFKRFSEKTGIKVRLIEASIRRTLIPVFSLKRLKTCRSVL